MAVREAGLLERDAELDELQAALEQARSGAGRMVVVEGAAGIGKTRLLQAARETAQRTGMRVLRSRGSELERDFPFALVRQLFEPVLHGAEPAEREDLLSGTARLAGPVVGIEPDGELGAGDSLLDPSFATLNALYWLTSNLAETQPILLAVDDAHWSDSPSLRFFGFLRSRLEDLPVLLALAARPPEPGAESELLLQLAADPGARVIRPRALSQGAVAELVRTGLSQVAHDEFCLACHQASGGNPFVVRDLLVELAAEGSSGTESDARRVREVAPATLQRAVLLRLGRLPDPAPRLAQAIAVLGDEAEPRQAAELAAIDQDVAAEAADALAVAGILEPGRPLRFVHPLMRNAVYADLSGAQRAAAHRGAAKLLAEGGAEPERVAVHLLATDPGANPVAIETLSAAALRALDRAAPEAAIAYVRRALAESPDGRTRRDLLGHLVRASARAGDREALEALGPDVFAELTADPQTLIASADHMSFWLYMWGRRGESVAVLERATRAAIEAGDYDLVMRFESLIITATRMPPAAMPVRLDRYRSHIQPDTPGERVWLAQRAWWGLFADESAGDMAEIARRALAEGKILREQPDSPIHSAPIVVLIRADELDDAERALERLWSDAAVRGATLTMTGGMWMRADLAVRRGDIARAEPDARGALEAARQGDFLMAFPHFITPLIDVLVERGELDAAQHEIETSGMDGEIPDDFYSSVVLHSRGCLRLAQGRTAEGLADLAELARRSRRDGIKNVASLPTAAVAAIAIARTGGQSPRGLIETYRQTIRGWGPVSAVALAGLGKGKPARGLAELYLRSARTWGIRRVIGIGLHALGVVEGGEKGIGLLREAVATLERSPARLEHARALTDLGAALRRANRRAEAREPLRAALEMARRRGALAIAKRAHEELEATGEKLRPLLAAGVESLTPSERRVAEMAAEGQTNRQIAQALFLTVKTVETHLSHAYRKLDIRSRSELPDALAQSHQSSGSVSQTVSPSQQI